MPAGNSWMLIARSPGLDAVNYYKVKVNETVGYSRGSFWIWNGGAYVSRVPDASLNFRLLGKEETTTQIADIGAAGACGQFIRAVRIETASGLYSSPYRAGTRTGLQEVKELLGAGTSGGGELLAEVRPDRTLRIFAQPTLSTLTMAGDGTILDRAGQRARPDQVCGNWITLNLPGMDVIDRQFITKVEVNDQGKIQLGY